MGFNFLEIVFNNAHEKGNFREVIGPFHFRILKSLFLFVKSVIIFKLCLFVLLFLLESTIFYDLEYLLRRSNKI